MFHRVVVRCFGNDIRDNPNGKGEPWHSIISSRPVTRSLADEAGRAGWLWMENRCQAKFGLVPVSTLGLQAHFIDLLVLTVPFGLILLGPKLTRLAPLLIFAHPPSSCKQPRVSLHRITFSGLVSHSFTLFFFGPWDDAVRIG
jgi:hypothetical protein